MQSNFFSAQLSRQLLEWYRRYGRKLPWRQTSDPYKIWISEVILQQTRVKQGWNYYERFIQTFPDIFTLAQADINQTLQLWEGLGYYSRALNLHAAAQEIVRTYKGEFPKTPEELLRLKGIGPYTANAIAAFAFSAPVIALDGNILRILSRFYADPTPIDKQKSYYQTIANSWLNGLDSATFNNALMDLGASICTPRNPRCPTCPLQTECQAWKLKIQDRFPKKSKNLKRNNKYYHFFLFQNESAEIYFIQRGKESFWKLLWVLPYEETTAEEFLKKEAPLLFQGKHAFTHFDMYFAIYQSSAQDYPIPSSYHASRWLNSVNLSSIALPAPLKKALSHIFTQPQLF